MSELFRSTGYATTIVGAAFRAEISFDKIRIWLADQGRKRTIRTSSLQSARIQPNGYTKLVLRVQKDLIIPTAANETVQLTKALDALLEERRAVELRRRQAAEDFRASPAGRRVRRRYARRSL